MFKLIPCNLLTWFGHRDSVEHAIPIQRSRLRIVVRVGLHRKSSTLDDIIVVT